MQSIVDPGASPNPERAPLKKLYALASELSSEKQSKLLKIVAELEYSTHAGQNNLDVPCLNKHALFEDLFEFAPDGYLVVDHTGRILLANQRLEEQFGYKHQELIGMPVERLVEASLQDRHREHIREYFSAPYTRPMGFSSELMGRRKDGSHFPVDITLGPFSHSGEILVIAAVRDNSERMQAEVRLREQQQLIDSVISIAPVIFFKVNRLGVIETSIGNSPAAVREGANPVGRSIYEVYSQTPHILEHFERAMRGHSGTYTVELDGHMYYTTYSPVQNGSDDISGMIGVAYDLTEYHQVVEALNQSEARFRAIFEHANLGIKLLDLQGRIVTSNPAFQKMLGYSAEELREMTYLDLTAPMDRWRHKTLLDELLAGERDQFRIEKRYLCKDNSLIWGRLSMSLFRDKDDQAAYAIGMVENITHQKQITAELTEVQRRLIDSRENERLFLAQELHDGPLQELQAMQFLFAELEQGNGASASLETGRETLLKVSSALREICGNLRPPTLAPFGLEKALRSYLDDFRDHHPELQVEADLMSDGQTLPEHVRLTLYRIFQNAMTNIVKHAAARHVRVQFDLDDEQIRLEIRDDGRGFKVPARLVELVRQGHFGVVGSIERAEAIGGKLQIDSQPGRGTHIQVLIPRQESYQPASLEGYLHLD
jgi:PAS domain S-box-containing protein